MSSELNHSVVLIEDEPVIAATVTYIIESIGARVETAAGLESGTAAVLKERPKVVLLDVELSDGCGLDLCSAIRLDPDVGRAKIILVSTHDSERLRTMAQQVEADGYLCKPFDPEVLLELVKDALGGEQAQAAAV